MQLTKHSIRLALDMTSRTSVVDANTADAPEVWRGTDLDVQLGLFNGTPATGTWLDSVANITSITLEIKDNANRAALAFVTETITAADLDAGASYADWASDDDEHGSITLSDDDLGLPAGEYWLVISAILTDGTVLTLGTCVLTISEDGANTGGGTGTGFLTTAQGDARYPLITPTDGSGYRFKAAEGLQLQDRITDLWHTIYIENGAIAIGAGEA